MISPKMILPQRIPNFETVSPRFGLRPALHLALPNGLALGFGGRLDPNIARRIAFGKTSPGGGGAAG